MAAQRGASEREGERASLSLLLWAAWLQRERRHSELVRMEEEKEEEARKEEDCKFGRHVCALNRFGQPS